VERGRVVFLGPNKEKFDYAIKLEFATTNNEAEYEAILSALMIAREMRIPNLGIRSDSQIIIGQISGDFAAQGDRMTKYLDKVCQFQCYFDELC
jgi:ribonuclease HI